jgi:MFS family permease
MTEHKKFTLYVLLASATLTIMAGAVLAPVLNLMREGLGVTPASVGIIITTHGLFMAIFSPLMGIFIDRKGPKMPYILGLAVFGIAGGSGLFINSYWLMLISRAFLGIGLATVFTAITVFILNMYEREERDRIMGWRGSAQSLGGVIWPLIGGGLGVLSWHLPFAVYLVAIPIGLLAVKAIPDLEPHRIPEEKSGNESSVLTIIKEKPMLYVVYGLMFSGNILLYVIVIYVPQQLETIGITSTFRISLFLSSMTLAAGVISFIYGKIRSRLSYRTIILTAMILWAIAFGLISQAKVGIIIFLGMSLLGSGQGLIMPTVMVWIGDLVPSSFRGRFSSYLGTFGYLGQFLSPIVFAPVFIMLGIRGVFIVSAGIGFAWFILLLKILKKA